MQAEQLVKQHLLALERSLWPLCGVKTEDNELGDSSSSENKECISWKYLGNSTSRTGMGGEMFGNIPRFQSWASG